MARYTDAYNAGVLAYAELADHCPYEGSSNSHCRTDWWTGYLDARTRERLKNIVESDWPEELSR